MPKGIEPCCIVEGNLCAIKDTSDFGGPNMWNFYVRTTSGQWEDVQWMEVNMIQSFFNSKLSRYRESDGKQGYIKD